MNALSWSRCVWLMWGSYTRVSKLDGPDKSARIRRECFQKHRHRVLRIKDTVVPNRRSRAGNLRLGLSDIALPVPGMSRAVRVDTLRHSFSNPPSEQQLKQDFRAFLPLPGKLEGTLEQALEHVLRNHGSLVRPQIVVEMASACGLPEAAGNDLAIALEYFHTASLLFDDLPCMDDAQVRRGAPCVHRVYGEAGAILAALGLINRAYALAWRAVSVCPPDRQRTALGYLEQCLGVDGLLNGQSFDLHYKHLAHDRETAERIAVDKTVSLVRLAIVLPALLGGAAESELAWLEQASMCWGLSYQILDDLKDVLGSDAENGKTAARDALLDRPNVALIAGIPGALERLAQLLDEGEEALSRLLVERPACGFLQKLCTDLRADMTRISQAACEQSLRG